jgi:glycosyltransferase involved in cell wall biosynthesis
MPTIRLVDSIIVPSEYLVRVFAKFGLEAQAIFNLIDTRRFRFRDRIPTHPIFLSNRNFERHYGVDKLLRAFAVIQRQLPEAKLTIAGDGPEREALHSLATELQLKNTTFLGRVNPDSIAETYDAADVYLNASEIDNQPLSLLEAFACGIPIVSTDAGGIPDIVTNNLNGILVPCGDIEQLAKRAIEVLENPDRTRNLIERGRRECVKYSWEAVKDSWLSAYHHLAKDIEGTQEVAPASSEPKVVSR